VAGNIHLLAFLIFLLRAVLVSPVFFPAMSDIAGN